MEMKKEGRCSYFNNSNNKMNKSNKHNNLNNKIIKDTFSTKLKNFKI